MAGRKDLQSKAFFIDKYEDFLKELELGDIIFRPFFGGLLQHAGIYCGSRKYIHPVVKKYLKPELNIVCPECGQDLVLMDCGHNVHFVAELSLCKTDEVEKSVKGLVAAKGAEGSSFRTKYNLCILKNFMEDKGAYKYNFVDEDVKPLPVEQILERAMRAVTNPKYRQDYNLLSFNCECFASFCRNGVATSKQVREIAEAILDTAVSHLDAAGYRTAAYWIRIIALDTKKGRKRPAAEAGSEDDPDDDPKKAKKS
ncbi:unnamed protein product [Darwinula stevensoni]|uniref:LRAT domain-containing protein n=1 Tax=Darwinula stevensoni TaxID=69355 RepID=A0A7R9FSK6_9CRUS|nr:unnamed protein product [Darwinula stevensoni]CAG0903700.1 unnamed protein product [Darwinula stevensoni]